MSAAILHVLRQRAFRAGDYSIAYQSCDHSTAQTGLFDERKCAANAKAYAANPDVIGVVGPYNSGCAYAEIPVASRAGLPLVSPTNSDVGLTRHAFGAPRGALRALYPTGRRTYVRLRSPRTRKPLPTRCSPSNSARGESSSSTTGGTGRRSPSTSSAPQNNSDCGSSAARGGMRTRRRRLDSPPACSAPARRRSSCAA
jgi:hypothetical protein